MRPFAFGPGINELEVVREIDGIQLVVHEFSDIPRQIVVPGREKRKKKMLNKNRIFSYFEPGGDSGNASNAATISKLFCSVF